VAHVSSREIRGCAGMGSDLHRKKSEHRAIPGGESDFHITCRQHCQNFQFRVKRADIDSQLVPAWGGSQRGTPSPAGWRRPDKSAALRASIYIEAWQSGS
jgi:hypothetical protein